MTDHGDIVTVTKDCSVVLHNRPVKKLGDPGKFVLSVQLVEPVFPRSLCDLETSVNLMTHSVAKRLGLTDFKPTIISIVFVDKSIKLRVGVLEDVAVKVGNAVEVDREPRDPLILGKPFLCTAGAMIDVQKRKIDLHLGDIVMKFEMDKLLQKPMMEQGFLVRGALDDTDDIEELIMDDLLEVALVKTTDDSEAINNSTKEYIEMLQFNEHDEGAESFKKLEEPLAGAEYDKNVNPWSEVHAPKVELKTLLAGLRYAFLDPNSNYR